MTRIVIRREGERITRLMAQGHAGDEAAGENIVCAAVSSLMHTAINALEGVAGVTPIILKDDDRALLGVSLPNGCTNRDAQTVLRTVIQGLTDISLEYPDLIGITTENGRAS
jgi:uncharacterized protein